MSAERFLVTGAMGCIGAWVTKLLVDEDVAVTCFDLSDDDHRHRLLLDVEARAKAVYVEGDLTDAESVRAAVEGSTHVIHLGALQIPFCRADPARGAAVNVLGTVHVFEAVRAAGVEHLVYASSVAVYGGRDDIVPADAERTPTSLYGVYKVANEDTASVYWREHGVASIGLRPHTVYGPGRDQGLTSQPTAAIAAAVAGEPYRVDYGGRAGFQFAPDVARIFIAAARSRSDGAGHYGIRGHVTTVGAFVDQITAVTGATGITYAGEQLELPAGMDDAPLRARLGAVVDTPLDEGIAETAAWFRRAGSSAS